MAGESRPDAKARVARVADLCAAGPLAAPSDGGRREALRPLLHTRYHRAPAVGDTGGASAMKATW